MTVYRTPHEKRPVLNLAMGFIFALALVLLLFFLGLPSLLSTSWGQARLLKYANEKIPGTIKAEDMAFSWLGPQKIVNFTVLDHQKSEVLRGDRLEAQMPLWDFLWTEIPSGEVQNLSGKLLVSMAGESNLQTALGLIPSMGTPISTIRLQGVNGTLQKNGIAHLAGRTNVNNTPGEFAMEISPEQLNGHVDNFPVELLQQIAGIRDLKNYLGETIDLELEQRVTPEGRILEGKIESTTLQAFLKGTFDPKDLQSGTGILQISKFKLADLPEVEIKDVEIPWQLNGETLEFGINGVVGAGVLRGGGTVHNWKEGANARVQGSINLSAIPVALMEKIGGTEGLAPLIGSSVDINLDVDSLEKLNLGMRGDQWSARAALVNESGWRLEEPAHATITMTPKRFTLLRNRMKKEPIGKFSLEAPAQIRISIDKIDLPPNAHWTETALEGNLAVDELAVLDSKTQQLIHLKNLHGDLRSSNLGKELQFNLQGQQITEQGLESDLKMKGTLQEGWLKNGSFNKERFSFNGAAQFQNLPAGMLCELLCLEEITRAKMEAVFGPLVNGNLNVQLRELEGPIQVSINGSLGSVNLDGLLRKSGLSLRSPFQLQLTASPALGESVLKDLLPILNGMESADQKLQLTIEPQGFFLPFNSHSLDNIQIEQLTLSLGRMVFQNDGQMGKIISLIRSTTEQHIPVWFTPIYVRVNKGIVQVQRFDMLALDRFPLAIWGTIDLPDDYINMVVGLTGKALQSALKIPIPDVGYMMQFPLKGAIGSATIDKSKAAAKIAALTAQIAGGPQGLVLGTVIGLATGAYTEPKAPAPTTKPFPWEGKLDEETEVNGEVNENAGEPKKTKNPVKALEKGLEKGLKKIFGK